MYEVSVSFIVVEPFILYLTTKKTFFPILALFNCMLEIIFPEPGTDSPFTNNSQDTIVHFAVEIGKPSPRFTTIISPLLLEIVQEALDT